MIPIYIFCILSFVVLFRSMFMLEEIARLIQTKHDCPECAHEDHRLGQHAREGV